MKLAVKNLSALQRAGEKLGLVFREESTYRWYGVSVGDYPLPEGITRDQLGKCHYTLSVPNNSEAYQVGIVRMDNGEYALLWDFWNGGFGLRELVGVDGCKLTAEYEAEVIKEIAAEMGYSIHETFAEDGTRYIDAVEMEY